MQHSFDSCQTCQSLSTVEIRRKVDMAPNNGASGWLLFWVSLLFYWKIGRQTRKRIDWMPENSVSISASFSDNVNKPKAAHFTPVVSIVGSHKKEDKKLRKTIRLCCHRVFCYRYKGVYKSIYKSDNQIFHTLHNVFLSPAPRRSIKWWVGQEKCGKSKCVTKTRKRPVWD